MDRDLNMQELWVPLTIRIAWELHSQGIGFGVEILQMAQNHVFSSLSSGQDIVHAERLAIIYTKEFIERLNGEAYVSPNIDDDVYMDVPLFWRELLERRASAVGKQVFYEHYRDGYSLQEVSAQLNLSSTKVKKVRNQLHQFVYRALLKYDMEDQDIREQAQQEWPFGRVEQLLVHLALVPKTTEIDCDILLSPEGTALRACPRLHHAYTLLKEGLISPEDLTVPKKLPIRCMEQYVLALQLNSEGRKFAKTLRNSLDDISLSIKGDIWFVSSDDLPALNDILHDLAEDGTPPRQMLRGAVAHGLGLWSDDAIFGPVATAAITLMRSRSWGDIDGISKLPEPIPPPKKPIKTWMAAVALFVLSTVFLQWALTSGEHTHYPIEAQSQARVQDVSIRFDVDDMAVLHVLSFSSAGFQVLHSNLIHEKGMLATKDGRYFLRASVDRLVVVSTPHEIENWDSLLEGVSLQGDPMASLTERILQKEPRACVVQSKERLRSEERSWANIIEDWTY